MEAQADLVELVPGVSTVSASTEILRSFVWTLITEPVCRRAHIYTTRVLLMRASRLGWSPTCTPLSSYDAYLWLAI